jgi:regulator of protease activity HflC (stomatin/prohibitin superfamily)
LDSDFGNIQQSEGFFILYLALIVTIIIFFFGVKIIRPTHRGLIETFGKYTKFVHPGFHWISKDLLKVRNIFFLIDKTRLNRGGIIK